MKKFVSLPGIGMAILFLIVSFFFISRSVEESDQFKTEKNNIAEILNFNDRLLSFRDWVFTETAWQEKKTAFEKVLLKADEHYTNAINNGHYLLYACLIFFGIVVLIYARKRLFFGITFALSVISFTLLMQGISNPALEISAFKDEMTIKVYVKPKDIPYFEEAVDYMGKISEIADYIKYVPIVGDEWADGAKELVGDGQKYLRDNSNTEFGKDQVFPGRTYFYYQNKGILDVITLLWKNDNKPVALAIGTFSILVPIIKLFFTFLILLLPVTGLKKMRKLLGFIAKWSMADVFVVGAFLAYLSFANMSTGVQMDAKVLFGLYFFGGYVLISILLGTFLSKSIKEKIAITEKDQQLAARADENYIK